MKRRYLLCLGLLMQVAGMSAYGASKAQFDPKACEPLNKREGVSMGSWELNVIGKEEGRCKFTIFHEMEVGYSRVECTVPETGGIVFIENYGPFANCNESCAEYPDAQCFKVASGSVFFGKSNITRTRVTFKPREKQCRNEICEGDMVALMDENKMVEVKKFMPERVAIQNPYGNEAMSFVDQRKLRKLTPAKPIPADGCQLGICVGDTVILLGATARAAQDATVVELFTNEMVHVSTTYGKQHAAYHLSRLIKTQ